MVIYNLKKYFSLENDGKIVLISLLITCTVCFASYNAFIVGGFSSPDGILEGLHSYIDRDWAIGGCGRWSLALINMAHANQIFDWLTIIECVFVNWLSAHTINKILDIKNKYLYCVSCVLFSIIPPIVSCCTYTYIAFPYCLSILLSVLYVYFNLLNKTKFLFVAALCLGIAMGSYQAQIGVAVCLTVVCIINKITNDDNVVEFSIKSLLSGIAGLIIYVIGLNVCLKIFDLELISRASSFSIRDVFDYFPFRFFETYKVFFSYFADMKLKRGILYFILLLIFAVEMIVLSYKMLKNKSYVSLAVVWFLTILFPAFINIVGIILPKSEITFLMLVPEYISLFLIIYLVDNSIFKWNNILSIILFVCLIFVSWTFVLSANATYDSYKLSYSIYKEQFSSALDNVYDLDNYFVNKTRIVVIGRPSDKICRDNIGIYKYAENLYDNLLYWNNPHLDPITTYQYLLNEFGIDGGVMEYEEYIDFVNKEECISMPSYPSKGYVQMIDGCAVIKFDNYYE